MASESCSAWALGWRTLRRDWRAGDLRVLALAIVLAVAALTAVAFFADRLQQGLQRDARQLLGGDVVLRSDHPLADRYHQQARALGLQTSLQLSFPTMARAPDERGGQVRLVALKAVDEQYPLRGQVWLWSPSDAPARAAGAGPARGEAWVDEAVLSALGLQVGDRLWLGYQPFLVRAVIDREPDRGGGFLSFAPRVLVGLGDVPATGLVQPASRVTYRLAVAGEDVQWRRYADWLQQAWAVAREPGVALESLDTGRPEMQQTLARAENFLNLVALLAVLLCGVAVALAARLYAQQHLDDCAMLRVMGVAQARMAWAYAWALLLLGLVASGVGVWLGWLAHHVLVALLADLLHTSMPAPSGWPAALGWAVGLLLTLACGWPAVLQLAQVPPLRVLRRELGRVKGAPVLAYTLGGLGVAVLLAVFSRDAKLAAVTLGGMALAMAFFGGVGYALVRLLPRVWPSRWSGVGARLVLRQWRARPGYTVVQIGALSVGLLTLLLLVLLRTDLIQGWRQATPAQAPNRFVINIQPEQAEAFQSWLREHGVTTFDWYPMVRGRLTAINGRPVQPQDYADERAQRLVDREFNLSFSATPPAHNTLKAGAWGAGQAGALSLETGLAQTLGVQLGDTMTFEVAGVAQPATVTSLRELDWTSLRVNFFAMFPVADVPDWPVTYITAFHGPKAAGFDRALLQAFPNVTYVDMSSTLEQVQQVLDQVVRAVEFLFGFTLAAGCVVLASALATTRADRVREFAVLRALGASAGLLRRVQRVELIGLGGLAGLLAALAATVVGWGLARYVFQFDWSVSWWVPLWGGVAGAVLAWGAGWWGLRGVLNTPVVETLRGMRE